MIKLIVGEKGSGKTRTLIHDANEAIKKAKGHLVFVDVDNSHMFQIDYKIRFMGIKEYHISGIESFYGFICGVIASNYDIETIYIDGAQKITGVPLEELKDLFARLDKLEMKYNVNFVFTFSGNQEELPDFLNKYMIQPLK
ncbi:hypothetical protein SAMN05660297_01539 [Natronincola peptidivorans]|uniref:Twitching motility protein PilT n=1 Tax=Natronincola peptidivorans TaxID=426128 RepID=A0A1I0C9Y1_9FIRM|nr:hypothetical protein [Natronincola peptidivorans]SET15922.1 hypothetical protein SAMN05660297_01539 [Natronincola peptidivorans]